MSPKTIASTTTAAALLLPGLIGMSRAAAVDEVGTDHWIRIQPVLWFPALDGDLAYQDSAVLDPDLIDVSTLELDSNELTPMLEVDIKLPLLFNVHAGYYAFGVDETVTLSEEFNFGDTTFQVDEDVQSEVDFTDIYAELSWRAIALDKAGLAIGLAVHVLDTEVQLQGEDITESFDEVIPVPALAARAYVNPIASVSVEARLQGMSLDVSDVEASFIDAALQVVYRPWEKFGFVGGYRHITYDIEYDFGDEEQGKVDLTLTGPYLGVVLQF